MSQLASTALITGASRSLGLTLVRQLARQGWHLIIDARGHTELASARLELAQWTSVEAVVGDITSVEYRKALAQIVSQAGTLDLLVNNASILGSSPQPSLLAYPLEVLEQVYRTNTFAPLALIQEIHAFFKSGACIINITSDAAVENYVGWGGYGSSKAALEQLSNILAAENETWRVYWVDPGDMNTRLHQEAFPGEEITDRPAPETSVPGLLTLIQGTHPSGCYVARSLL